MAVYEVVIEGRQGVDDMLTILHYQVQDGLTLDWQAGADEIRSHLANYIAPLCTPTITWVGIRVREDIAGSVGTLYTFTLGTLDGSNVEGDLVRQASVLAQKRSDGPVRPVLGWFFQGGITAHGTTGAGRWEPSISTDVLNYAEDIRVLGGVATQDVTMVIKARNPTAPNTQPYTVVDRFTVSGIPRTVKSRREAVGS